MTVTAIDATFDSYAHSDGTQDETSATLLVAASDGSVLKAAQIKFATVTPLAGASAVSDSTLQINVTVENVEAGEGVTVHSYFADGVSSDPDTDTGANKYARSDDGALVDIDCSSTGSKTGDLTAAADAEILASVSGVGYWSAGLVQWAQEAFESVSIEALENAGSDPATLTVTWTITATGTIASSLAKVTASATVTQVYTTTVASLLAKVTDALTVEQSQPTAIASLLATVTFSGTSSIYLDSVIASLLAPVSDDVQVVMQPDAVIAALLAPVSDSLTVSQEYITAVASLLAAVSAALSVSQEYPVSIASLLAPISDALTVTQEYPLAIATLLAAVSSSFTVASTNNATIATLLAAVIFGSVLDTQIIFQIIGAGADHAHVYDATTRSREFTPFSRDATARSREFVPISHDPETRSR